ncbi:MAG: DUF1786 domain-containing protein [Chloroflexi bacterium]|nr:DUF1786 domain-containing protein [Chloroflexota bacterium]
MKILTVDIGTGTQDIFLYDSRVHIENGFKLVLPSPTMMVRQRIRQATAAKRPILLSGVIMGGGPSQWAAEEHARAGLPLFATPQAARTFNDDLDAVREMGVEIVSEDEAARLDGRVERIELRDFDFPAIAEVFARFGVSLHDLAAVAVAVFDHGDSPPDYSDRQFRFDYLDERIRAENRLSAFAFPADSIPRIMTRLQAVAASAQDVDAPLVVMDTAPAAVLGATFDPEVRHRSPVIIANVGNFHTLAFRLGAEGIEGVFEHHTGLIDVAKLDGLLVALAKGTLRHEDVFDDHGHGALMYRQESILPASAALDVVVTGPRRSMMQASSLNVHFAAPFGDMMISGCFGMLAAVADIMPELADPIRASMSANPAAARPPWEVM